MDLSSPRRVTIPFVRGLAARTETATILIVDDDEGVTQTFARMLRLEGYQVRTAVTAEKGLQVAAESPPDAIVTGDYFLDDAVSNELRELGAELRFKPMWLEDLVGLARNLLGATS